MSESSLSDADAELVRQKLAEYEEVTPRLKRTKRQVLKAIRAALREHELKVHVVSGRVKSKESLADKLIERPRRKIEDLIGVRIITLHQSHIPAVEAIVRSVLEVRSDSGPRIDKQAQLGSAEFGYRSIQFVAHLPRAMDSAAPIWMRDVVDWSWLGSPTGTVEVQIRTVLAHGWAEVQHALVYKRPLDAGSAPYELKRRLAMAAALTETADALLDDALNLSDVPMVETKYAPSYSSKNWLSEILETRPISRQLDQQIAEALNVPLRHPEQHRRQVSYALGFSNLTTASATSQALEEYETLARRAAMICENPSRSLVSPDSQLSGQRDAEAYDGIGLYWVALVYACFNTPANGFRMSLLSVEQGRVDEYFTVIQYLAQNPDESAVAIRDRYRRVAAPAGSTRFPPIHI